VTAVGGILPLALSRGRQPRGCLRMAQAGGEGGPPPRTAIPIITNYRKLSRTIGAVWGSSGSPGALHAAPSRANVSWGCNSTFAAVVCHAGARWCCPFPHWHAMDATPHRRQNVTRTSRASEVSMPALSSARQARGCLRIAQAGGEGGPPRGTAIRIITNYRKLSRTIAAVCGSSGSPGALHAAPSRANVSWGCSNTFAAVVCHAGARWCCPFPHWHAMDATPHRRQNVTRTSRASEVSMPALSRVGQPRGCLRMAQAGGEGGPSWGTAIRIITNYRKLSQIMAAVCGSRGSPGALHAARSRANVSWGCSNTFAAVVCHAGARWCCPFPHWHAMDATPHRRQNFTRTSRASELSMPALSRVGQPRGCWRMAQAGGEGGPPRGTAIPIITNYRKLSQTIAAV